jgi:hypothetical protein
MIARGVMPIIEPGQSDPPNTSGGSVVGDAGPRRAALRWLVTYVAVTLGSIAVVLVALWVFDGFQGFGLDTGATVATVIGIMVTSALGVGLMGLIFYSDRSHADEDAYSATVESAAPSPENGAATTPDEPADPAAPEHPAER